MQTNITTLRIPLRVYHGYLACDEGTAPCEEISINIGAVPVRGEKRVLVQSKALGLDLTSRLLVEDILGHTDE